MWKIVVGILALLWAVFAWALVRIGDDDRWDGE